jgi:hypothetical protein
MCFACAYGTWTVKLLVEEADVGTDGETSQTCQAQAMLPRRRQVSANEEAAEKDAECEHQRSDETSNRRLRSNGQRRANRKIVYGIVFVFLL